MLSGIDKLTSPSAVYVVVIGTLDCTRTTPCCEVVERSTPTVTSPTVPPTAWLTFIASPLTWFILIIPCAVGVVRSAETIAFPSYPASLSSEGPTLIPWPELTVIAPLLLLVLFSELITALPAV